MSKALIDTNILTYAADPRDPAKRARAREALTTLHREGQGVISTQVLQEFYVTLTRKLGMAPLEAKNLVHLYAKLETVTITPQLIGAAIDCSIVDRLSFWDALVVVAAESARCAELWTEDLNAGQVIRGVRIVNPFTRS